VPAGPGRRDRLLGPGTTAAAEKNDECCNGYEESGGLYAYRFHGRPISIVFNRNQPRPKSLPAGPGADHLYTPTRANTNGIILPFYTRRARIARDRMTGVELFFLISNRGPFTIAP